MMNEAEFLSHLTRRLGREKAIQRESDGRPRWDSGLSLPAASPVWEVDALWERFASEAAKLGAETFRAESAAAAHAYVVEVVTNLATAGGASPDGQEAVAAAGPDDQAHIALACDESVVSALGLTPALAEKGIALTVWGQASAWRGDEKRLAARSLVGITGVDWAVAETGTILLSAAPGRGRLVSLLPPVHIALIRPERLLPSVAESFRRIAAAGELPSSLVLVTGPSRSADIENDLSIGVHGPRSVHLVLLPE